MCEYRCGLFVCSDLAPKPLDGSLPYVIGLGLPLGPVGNLEIFFFGLTHHGGGIILEKLKSPNFLHAA